MKKSKRVIGKNWWDCCAHCGCSTAGRIGHEEPCPMGCNAVK